MFEKGKGMFLEIVFLVILIVSVVLIISRKNLNSRASSIGVVFVLLILVFGAFVIGEKLDRGSAMHLYDLKPTTKFKVVAIYENKYCLLQKSEVDPLTLKLFVETNNAPVFLQTEMGSFTNGQFVIALKDGMHTTLHPFPITDTNFAGK